MDFFKFFYGSFFYIEKMIIAYCRNEKNHIENNEKKNQCKRIFHFDKSI